MNVLPHGRADVHLHTTFSDGLVPPGQLLDVAEAHGFDVIAVTDHDTVSGARAVEELADFRGCNVQVIRGIEVTATRGIHILGLFVDAPIKMYQSIVYTVDAIADAGGICLAPHPLSPLTPSLGRRSIERLLDAGKPLVGVETANPTPAGRFSRRKVVLANQSWKLTEFGGSDAHFMPHVGAAYTAFPGSTPMDLRWALLHSTTTGEFSAETVRSVPPYDYARQFSRSMIRSPAHKIANAVRRRCRTP